jgi:hypothetical protein
MESKPLTTLDDSACCEPQCCSGGESRKAAVSGAIGQAGFARVEVEKHAEAARTTIEAWRVAPPPCVEHLLSVNFTAIK